MPHVSRRTLAQGSLWSVPTVAIASQAPAVAATGTGATPYPTTPIYRNWAVDMYEQGTVASCQKVIDATVPNDTTLGADASGFWLDADTPGYGDLADLTFTTTSRISGLTWTVTETSGIGSWTYAGETRNPDGTSTYTFVYSGPNKMQVHVPPCAGCDYQVQRTYYTGFKAVSSSTGTCGQGETWTNTTKSSLWGRGAYSGTQQQAMVTPR